MLFHGLFQAGLYVFAEYLRVISIMPHVIFKGQCAPPHAQPREYIVLLWMVWCASGPSQAQLPPRQSNLRPAPLIMGKRTNCMQ